MNSKGIVGKYIINDFLRNSGNIDRDVYNKVMKPDFHFSYSGIEPYEIDQVKKIEIGDYTSLDFSVRGVRRHIRRSK